MTNLTTLRALTTTSRERRPVKAKVRYKITNVWVTLLLSIGAVIMVAPLLWMLTTSLKDKESVFALPPEWIPSPAHWDTYLRIWTEGPLASGIRNSLIVSLSVTVVGSLVSALAAFAFAKMRLPGKSTLFLLLLSGMMIPFPTLMIPQFMMFSRIGWVDTLLPLIVPGMFGNIMMVFFLRQYLASTPDSLIEAARVDGASFPQIFFRMILPLIRPAIAAQFILWFMGVWNDYLAPTIYLNSPEKQTLQLVIANFNSNYAIQSDYPLIMAASIVALLPIFVIFLLFQRQIIESVALTGTKA
ncbi:MULTISPECIES: carbohydrate ABC transporter permease [unclassified Actinomyces]|uniref:carbohydrate ABC transporter permease n=1 Tax=unclassified Actinomyces TaxID=2609248 RepID=UPI002017DC99|nr:MULTISPECIES: carbohydrate ABC transporter permease [unclassified Actinomyces]MCL3777101.1 carbohydrate ABC transporter permease [Actinomyces sp. AC-20-1]MCL3790642.1 carbohydrate ABC transporter permease [Actinomyces sp. 187325]MCL3792951.1 carbohydrate ABC transporter permease [Actinomyces sp. 186855]MCL3794765.1 carbohydrate ABC transporter permease [Actinomyces sp. 217892]